MEDKREQQARWMSNVDAICGKTWAEVAADFEAEMEQEKRLERQAREAELTKQRQARSAKKEG